MADLLTHVLAAYALATIASWRYERLTKPWVAVVTIGALLPDLNRIGLLITDAAVESALGVSFDIDGIHTLGGAVLLAGAGAMVVTDRHHRVFALLVAGALSHLLVDGVKAYADGEAGVWLYPFTWYRHPTPNVYVSSDPNVLAAVLLVAIAVAGIDRTRDSSDGS